MPHKFPYLISLSFWVGHEGIWEFPWNISYKLFFPEVLWKKFLGRKSTNLKLLFQRQLNSFTECPTLNFFSEKLFQNPIPIDISSDMPNIFNVQWAMVPFGINRWRFMPWANIQKHLFLLPSLSFVFSIECIQNLECIFLTLHLAKWREGQVFSSYIQGVPFKNH